MAAKKTGIGAQKQSESEQVDAWMSELVHPLKSEIEAVRAIIKKSSPKLSERIKWKAPSYYYGVDLVTFNPRMTDNVHLVFHHETIVTIDSPLLEGTYKDRRMMYFRSMADVETHQSELERIIKAYVDSVETSR